MSQITIINNSTDQNNSQVVIFESTSNSKFATAAHFLSLASGAKSSIAVAENTKFIYQ